jgi:hypothetical protein
LECLEALSFSYAITSSFEKGFSTAYEAIDLSKKICPYSGDIWNKYDGLALSEIRRR